VRFPYQKFSIFVSCRCCLRKSAACSARQADLKVLPAHRHFSTPLEIHRVLKKQGENAWKFTEEENPAYN